MYCDLGLLRDKESVVRFSHNNCIFLLLYYYIIYRKKKYQDVNDFMGFQP